MMNHLETLHKYLHIYYLNQKTKYKIALSGDGGDEVFLDIIYLFLNKYYNRLKFLISSRKF